MGFLRIPAQLDEAETDLREADDLYAGIGGPTIDGLDCQTERDGNRYYLGVALHDEGKDDEAGAAYCAISSAGPPRVP